jgi:SAM-dependent methyltransferase
VTAPLQPPTLTDILTKLLEQAPYQPATDYWRAIEISEVIRHGLPSGHGLDLGCGDGHIMAIIFEYAGKRDMVGVDIDDQETAMARGRNLYREVVTTGADHLPFPDSHFDFVFSNSVLEHIEPIEKTLREVGRVLRRHGQFLFTVPGPDFRACLRGSLFADREAYLRSVDARCAHLRYWSESEWAGHLRDAGLDLVHQHGYLAENEVQRWESIARYTSGILYGLARGKKQPIDIQRRAGVRSTRFRLPKTFASGGALALSTGVSPRGSRFGCLLIEARKT